MRNLVLLSASSHAVPVQAGLPSSTDSFNDRVAPSPSSDRLYVATTSTSSHQHSDLVNFEVYEQSTAAHRSVNARKLCSFAAPRSPSGPPRAQVLSLSYLSDITDDGSDGLVIVTAGGDIGVIALPTRPRDDAVLAVPLSTPEIVGSVEQGILTAAWSPDEEKLVLVTAASQEQGPEKLLVMSRNWEVEHEAVLSSAELGKGESSAQCWWWWW